jgi:hypothetical protein
MCLTKVLGRYLSVGGPLGTLCAEVLFAAFETYMYGSLSHPELYLPYTYNLYLHHPVGISHFVTAVVPSAKRLRIFADSVPYFKQGGYIQSRVWLGARVAAWCAIDLACNRAVVRAEELLDVLFELPGSSTMFFRNHVRRCIFAWNKEQPEACCEALSPWLHWHHSLRGAWVTACVKRYADGFGLLRRDTEDLLLLHHSC